MTQLQLVVELKQRHAHASRECAGQSAAGAVTVTRRVAADLVNLTMRLRRAADARDPVIGAADAVTWHARAAAQRADSVTTGAAGAAGFGRVKQAWC